MAKDKKTKSKARKRFRLFAGISEERKSTLIKYTGWALTAFTLYTLVSVGSYLFTWKADQSLLTSPDMLDQAVEVQNWGTTLVISLFLSALDWLRSYWCSYWDFYHIE